MATKRVTDERREKMSIRAARCYALHMETPDVSIDNAYPDLLHDYTTDVDDLLHDYATVEAENQRLRAENAAMRPMVEAAATLEPTELGTDWGRTELGYAIEDVDPIIEQARAFVAAHPATDTAGEAESEGEGE